MNGEPIRSRSTTEIVVLMFTFLICTVMIISFVGVIIAKTVRPELDVSKVSDAMNGILSTIVGALVGFISGRAYGKREEQIKQNGESK
ncbi:MAG TPA: hypothetical protein VFQ43_10445 [Nitrososphaera sp.]|nr:hypothetical protein [Nitrososphaera sp.]